MGKSANEREEALEFAQSVAMEAAIVIHHCDVPDGVHPRKRVVAPGAFARLGVIPQCFAMVSCAMAGLTGCKKDPCGVLSRAAICCMYQGLRGRVGVSIGLVVLQAFVVLGNNMQLGRYVKGQDYIAR